jgi:hypothetical protein
MISATTLLIAIVCGFSIALFVNVLVDASAGWRAERKLRKFREQEAKRRKDNPSTGE